MVLLDDSPDVDDACSGVENHETVAVVNVSMVRGHGNILLFSDPWISKSLAASMAFF